RKSFEQAVLDDDRQAEGDKQRRQDIAQALKVADGVYCMMEGRVTLSGRADDLSRDEIHRAYFGTDHHELA
ncbi:hypothetical protein AB9F46_36270, partial [Rhizobium leguminosarum]